MLEQRAHAPDEATHKVRSGEVGRRADQQDCHVRPRELHARSICVRTRMYCILDLITKMVSHGSE